MFSSDHEQISIPNTMFAEKTSPSTMASHEIASGDEHPKAVTREGQFL
jgi:hypothetical protein